MTRCARLLSPERASPAGGKRLAAGAAGRRGRFAVEQDAARGGRSKACATGGDGSVCGGAMTPNDATAGGGCRMDAGTGGAVRSGVGSHASGCAPMPSAKSASAGSTVGGSICGRAASTGGGLSESPADCCRKSSTFNGVILSNVAGGMVGCVRKGGVEGLPLGSESAAAEKLRAHPRSITVSAASRRTWRCPGRAARVPLPSTRH